MHRAASRQLSQASSSHGGVTFCSLLSPLIDELSFCFMISSRRHLALKTRKGRNVRSNVVWYTVHQHD